MMTTVDLRRRFLAPRSRYPRWFLTRLTDNRIQEGRRFVARPFLPQSLFEFLMQPLAGSGLVGSTPTKRRQRLHGILFLSAALPMAWGSEARAFAFWNT